MTNMMKTLLAVALAALSTAAYANSLALVGKVFTPQPVPASGDATHSEFGDGYFECGGSVREDGQTHFTLLRKGFKAKCYKGNGTIALTRPSNGNKQHEVLDALDVKYRAKEVIHYDCTGAAVVISKEKDVEILTEHLAAWKIVNNKFVPITDLKPIRCSNQSYGV